MEERAGREREDRNWGYDREIREERIGGLWRSEQEREEEREERYTMTGEKRRGREDWKERE
jgi:hypothetical protein